MMLKVRWGLDVDPAERDVLAARVAECRHLLITTTRPWQSTGSTRWREQTSGCGALADLAGDNLDEYTDPALEAIGGVA
ncbi:hypothetical protein ABTZ99_05725 [Actinosynnema sp. NPDC002837]